MGACVVCRVETARSRQLGAILTAAGHAVVVADAPDRASGIIVWAEPAGREQPYPDAVNVADLAFWPGALAGGARRRAWREMQIEACRGADLALAGSEAELGFWSGEFARAGVRAPLMVLPAVAAVLRGEVTRLSSVIVVLENDATDAMLDRLQAAAAWVASCQGTLQVVVPVQRGMLGLATMRRVRRLGAVTIVDELAGAAPGVLLDLRDDTAEERVGTPPSVAAALGAGWPVLSTVAGAVTQRIEAGGAGLFATDVAEGLTHLGAGDLARLSRGARNVGAAVPDRLGPWVVRAVERRREAHAAWRAGGQVPQPLGPDAHVLVISDEHENLADIRIHLPFGAMHRRGAIAGYAVMRHGRLVFSTRATGRNDPDPAFHALWVHRGSDPRLNLLLRALDRPFCYDLDDNLLASPEYRQRFGRGSEQAVLGLIGRCAVLSASTVRLVSLLQGASAVRLADRAVVTPNLAVAQPVPIQAGMPRALVWVSSDTPALTGMRENVERAVRDFCAAHRLKLIFMGAAPPSMLRDAGIAVEHVGILPHAAYLEYLRALSPSILVCPLEAAAASSTQDFIDGKSDVKMLDAAAAGLVGVYSTARPYTDSGLGPHILCDNTHAGWLDGLERAYRACGHPGPAPVFPPSRVVTEEGLAPWAAALSRARLASPLYWSEMASTLDYVAQRRSRFLPEDNFDAEYYLDMHEDVGAAVREGHVASAYEHYRVSGYAERRDARAYADSTTDTQAWWDHLLQAVDLLERGTAARGPRIEALQDERAARRSLRS